MTRGGEGAFFLYVLSESLIRSGRCYGPHKYYGGVIHSIEDEFVVHYTYIVYHRQKASNAGGPKCNMDLYSQEMARKYCTSNPKRKPKL